MIGKILISIIFLLFSSMELSGQDHQNKDSRAIMKYLYELPKLDENRLISGQFERWGDAVEPLSDSANFLNIVHRKTGKWVGLVGVEYHIGPKVLYEQPNQLCIEYWKNGGFSQLYLIMSNPAQPDAINGGGRCDVGSILDKNHPYNKYYFGELEKVADGLEILKKNGVVIFVNMFAEATGSWFWWGGNEPSEFKNLYKITFDYLVNQRGLDNLLFVYEPSSHHKTAMDYYPGDKYVDIIGISLFVDYDVELNDRMIPNYSELLSLGKPMALSQWGPRRGEDQTRSIDQPPADNMKLIRGITRYYPDIVWWMNWCYAYSISTSENSNYNDKELLNHPWVINLDEINWRK